MGIRADEMVALHIAEGREHLNAKELEKAHESYTKAYEAIFSLKEAKQQELFPSMHDLYRDIVALQDRSGEKTSKSRIRSKQQACHLMMQSVAAPFLESRSSSSKKGLPSPQYNRQLWVISIHRWCSV